jgi:hypothetical protein
MTDAPPKIGDTRPAADGELCPSGGKQGCSEREVVHISAENLRNLRRIAAKHQALNADLGAVRRQAALWRAGIKPGPAADLFLAHMPDDVNLNDAEAVRQACARITSAVLDGRSQLAGVTP